jgi:hypothetical protein
MATACIAGLVVYRFRRPSAAERERRRRLKVHREGRITDGTITDLAEAAQDDASSQQRLVHYAYSIGGVEYSACQDVSMLTEHISEDPSILIGSVYVKYHSKNPHNSIIVCEEWSGLRQRRRA